MMYNFILTVSQDWQVSVEADNHIAAVDKAIKLYRDSPNPWDDENLVDEGDETIKVKLA
jgi:hypothetical protein